jgi:DNA modification methylase
VNLGTATVLRGDARALPLPDASVDLIVTSPPYWALRSYTDGGEHYDGQIGSEPTPGEYIAALLECTREWMRVLKPGGSIWVNLGDKYNSAASNQGMPGGAAEGFGGGSMAGKSRPGRGGVVPGIRPKSLMLLPERYRIGCLDQLGLIARAVVIWAKPNGLPESVTDRVRRSHEDWVHLTKQPRYFAAVNEIREPHSAGTHPGRTRSVGNESGNGVRHCTFAGNTDMSNPLGKLPGSVWEIASEPLAVPEHLGVDHFAAFPTEWPKRIILGWSPSGYCTACGAPRQPRVHVEHDRYRAATSTGRPKRQALTGNHTNGQNGSGYPQTRTTARILGYACACPDAAAPTRPAVVLDPFGGTGTTALVAKALGRHGITVDMSADYCRIAEWRTTDPAQLAKVLDLPKPPVEKDGQQPMFDLATH